MESPLKMVLKLVLLFLTIATILVGSANGRSGINIQPGVAYPDWTWCQPALCPSNPKCCLPLSLTTPWDYVPLLLKYLITSLGLRKWWFNM